MDLDIRDITRLLVSFGMSLAIFMGFWTLWLKTRNGAFKAFAFWVGPMPAAFVLMVVVGRFLFATGTIHQYETYAMGGKGEAVVRELAFPVVDSELRHELEIEPVLDQVSLKDGNGEALELRRAVSGNILKVEYETRRPGSYLIKMNIPAAVSQVRIVAREIR
jgi:hypothetical protein